MRTKRFLSLGLALMLIFTMLTGCGTPAVEEKPAAKKIPVRNTKRLSEERIYAKKKKEYLTKHIKCEVPGCNHAAEELHHKKGRIGKLLYNEKYFMGVCIPHHRM